MVLLVPLLLDVSTASSSEGNASCRCLNEWGCAVMTGEGSGLGRGGGCDICGKLTGAIAC